MGDGGCATAMFYAPIQLECRFSDGPFDSQQRTGVIRPSPTVLGDVGATKFLDREQLKETASDINMAGQAMDQLRLIHPDEQIVASLTFST